MPKATEEEIAETKAANPGIELHVTTHPLVDDVQEFIVRAPSRAVWNLFRNRQADPAEKALADDVLFDGCVLWPPKAERDAIVGRAPALLNMCAAEIAEIAGAHRGGSHRKL